jgi:hypothetical protein
MFRRDELHESHESRRAPQKRKKRIDMNAFACLRTSTTPPHPNSVQRPSSPFTPVQNCRPCYPTPQFATNSHLFPAIPAISRLFFGLKNSNSLIGNHLFSSVPFYKKFPWNFPFYTRANNLYFGYPNLILPPYSRLLASIRGSRKM